MKKNKLKLLLSIIICFSLINIGGVFSYAGGGSSGGGGGGSVGPAGNGDFIQPIVVFKKWKSDKTGNYGPDKDKPVIINADLSFQVEHEGEVLNFEISRHSETQRIENAPRMPGQSDQIALIDFVTGKRIDNNNNDVISYWYVTTIKDKDGKGYVAQFMSRDILIKASTHEARIKAILVYKEPKNPILPPPGILPQERIPKKIEQPDPNATVYCGVKAKLTISEMHKYKDYDENLEIDLIRVGPPVAPVDGLIPRSPMPDFGSENDPRNHYLPYPILDITVTNTYNPPVPEEEKPPVPPEENTPPKNPPKEKTKNPSVPNTGDSEAFMVLISLLAIGTAGAVVAVKRKNS